MVQYKKENKHFRNLSTGCHHAMATDINLANASLNDTDRVYLNKFLQVLGGDTNSFLNEVGGLITKFDGNSSWSNSDVFFNCYNRPADWAAYKAALSQRNTTIPKLVGDELNRRGVVVTIQDTKTGGQAPAFIDVSYAQLAQAANAAVNSGTGVTEAFSTLSGSYNLGNLNDDIRTFMADPANASYITDSVRKLNYVIPTDNDDIDLIKFKQIYWGAYYLKKFPIPGGLLSTVAADCGQIGQTLIQLAAEKANLKQSDLDKLYTLYNEGDQQQRMQAVADVTTIFNGLYGSNNCSAAQTSSGNDVMKYVLYGLAGVFVLVIVVRLFKHHK